MKMIRKFSIVLMFQSQHSVRIVVISAASHSGMSGASTKEIAISAKKSWSVCILRTSHLKYSAENAFTEIAGIQQILEDLLIFKGRFSGNSKIWQWRCRTLQMWY